MAWRIGIHLLRAAADTGNHLVTKAGQLRHRPYPLSVFRAAYGVRVPGTKHPSGGFSLPTRRDTASHFSDAEQVFLASNDDPAVKERRGRSAPLAQLAAAKLLNSGRRDDDGHALLGGHIHLVADQAGRREQFCSKSFSTRRLAGLGVLVTGEGAAVVSARTVRRWSAGLAMSGQAVLGLPQDMGRGDVPEPVGADGGGVGAGVGV